MASTRDSLENFPDKGEPFFAEKALTFCPSEGDAGRGRENTMKKMLTLFAALAIGASVIGCGSSDESTTTTEKTTAPAADGAMKETTKTTTETPD